MSLTRAVRYESMFSFKYSPRPNTLALKRYADDVSEEEKTRRIVALQALQREIQLELHEAAVGSDGRSPRRFGQPAAGLGASGRTVRQYRREFSRAAEWLGRTVPVRITRAGAYSLAGRRAQLDRALSRGLGLETGTAVQIEMTIKGLMVDPVTNMPIILLRDSDGQKVLPIWVGIYEANAIALQIENVSTPRPMTHDLLKNVITDLKGQRAEDRGLGSQGQHVLRA